MSRLTSTPATEEAVQRGQDDARGALQQQGPVLEVYFASAADRRDIAHRLGVVPTGYVLLLERGGHVVAVDVEKWTTDIAYLKADTANTRVRLFFVTTEVPIHA